VASGGLDGVPLLGRVAAWHRRSFGVRSADHRVDDDALDGSLGELGADGKVARRLDLEVDALMPTVAALSSLTSPLALDYLQRLERPIPTLTPAVGVQIVSRSYVAHAVVEADPGTFGAETVPVLNTLPPLRRGGVPPQDLLTRVVKASRRKFQRIRAVPEPVWAGYVLCLAWRAHEHAGNEEELVAVDVVDGLARFGWVLRLVDIRYGLEPERRVAPKPPDVTPG
jgi:hypothetical protein